MRVVLIATVSVLCLIGCNQPPAQGAPVDAVEAPATKPAAPAATPPQAQPRVVATGAEFKRADPASATLILSEEGEVWRVAIRAGGVPNGGATAADCEVQAVGAQNADDVIAARVVPFNGELNEVTATDIGANAPVVQVRVGPEGVIVHDGGAAARLCGVGSDIGGFYRRTETPD